MTDVIILDGAAIINMLKPIGVKTFQDYATHVFLPFIKVQLRNVTRIYIIWDVYLEDSLKSTAREIRGRGIQRRVAPSNTIPGNWKEFLRLAENKTELFDSLAHQVVENLSGELNDDCMSVLEAFFCTLCDRTCTETTVNLARKHIFTTKGRSMDNLPPPRAALFSTQNEQYTRVDMCGGKHSSVVHYYLPRNIRLAEECDARMATVMDIAARSGGIVF